MSDDAATGSCTNDAGTDGGASAADFPGAVVRIGVKSTTGKKEDKVVRLSINIPNYRRSISVEVPLQKILEDDDDDDDDDSDSNARVLSSTADATDLKVCSICHQTRFEVSTKRITEEIKTSLRQLLLSKLLERLAKKTLFKNYERLVARETEGRKEFPKSLSITYNSVEDLLQASTLDETGATSDSNSRDHAPDAQQDEERPRSEDGQTGACVSISTQTCFEPTRNDESSSDKTPRDIDSSDKIQTEKHSTIVQNLAGNAAATETSHTGVDSSRYFADVATETVSLATKVDKYTTIHRDESTQTGNFSYAPATDFRSYSGEIPHSRQPSSISSSCQTDLDENAAFEVSVSRAGSDDSKVEATKKLVGVPASMSPIMQSRFNDINGELEESERDETRTPQPHDDSATETESASSSFASSVSSSALRSRPEKSVMSLGKEVAQVCQKKFLNSDAAVAARDEDGGKKQSKSNLGSKSDNSSNKIKDNKSSSSAVDSYLKNLKTNTTSSSSSEQVASKDTTGELGRRRSKDNQSTPTKNEIPSTDNAQVSPQKISSRGRSSVSKPVSIETKSAIDFGADYTKKQTDGHSDRKVPQGSTTASPSSIDQTSKTLPSAGQTVKVPQVKSGVESRKGSGSTGVQLGAESEADSVRSATSASSTVSGKSGDKAEDTASSKSSEIGKSQGEVSQALSNVRKRMDVLGLNPEAKFSLVKSSPFRNLVSSFETKGKADDQPAKKHPNRISLLK